MKRMATKEHRKRQKASKRRRFQIDLTKEEWERSRPIQPLPRRSIVERTFG
jgi:hypothetical protein